MKRPLLLITAAFVPLAACKDHTAELEAIRAEQAKTSAQLREINRFLSQWAAGQARRGMESYLNQ